MKKNGTPREREEWILSMWLGGRRGKLDFFKEAKNLIPYHPNEVTKWRASKSFGGTRDIEIFDTPRTDVDKLKVHGRNIAVGGSGRKKVRKHVKRVIESNFTREEINDIKNLYIETSTIRGGGWTGQHQGITLPNGKTGSIITIRKKYHNDENVLTHELIHAHRRKTGRRYPFDRNSDEKETELETIARINNIDIMTTGYYWHIPGVVTNEQHNAAITSDRIGITGSKSKKFKGKKAIKKSKEYYKKSQISKAKFSPGERVDRYFYIVLPNKTKIDVHQRYPKGNGNLVQIRKDFRKKYGSEIKIWEYRNGKKVRI